MKFREASRLGFSLMGNGGAIAILVITTIFTFSLYANFAEPKADKIYGLTGGPVRLMMPGTRGVASAYPVIIIVNDGSAAGREYELRDNILTRNGKPANFEELRGPTTFMSHPDAGPDHGFVLFWLPSETKIHAYLSLAACVASVGLIGWFFYRGKAFVKLEPSEWGFIPDSNKLLLSGVNHVGLTGKALAMTAEPMPATATVQQAMSQDGAQFTVSVSYLIQPNAAGYDKAFTFKDTLTGQIEKKVQAAIRRQMKRFATWHDAAHGDEELQRALVEDFSGPEGDAILNTYGVRVADFTVNSITPVGELAGMSLMGLSKEKGNAKKSFRAMAESIKELEEMRGKLLEAGLREDEVKRIIEKRRLEILDDE